MTHDQISMQLKLAPAPAGTEVRFGPQGSWISSFTVTRILQKAVLFLSMAALSYCFYFVANTFVIKSVKVVGKSMVPTLKENDRYLLNIWELYQRDPQRGDIVVIRDPGDHGLSVKRVIAVGGEAVLFKNGKVYVNGHELNEPYLMANVRTFTYSAAHQQLINVGKDEYFVMGDNRLVSIDSRSYGPVTRDGILGYVKPH